MVEVPYLDPILETHGTVSKSIIQNDGQDTGQVAVMAGTWQIATANPDYTDIY
jgi:hypothetical protein